MVTSTIANTTASRLDRLTTRSFHQRRLGMAGGGLLTDNFDTYIDGPVLFVLLHSGSPNPSYNATFVFATFAGMMGTFCIGIAGNRYGRKLTFRIKLGIFRTPSLAAVTVTNMNILIAMRFICGIGRDAAMVTGYSTLSECVPPKSRGNWLALLFMMSSCGLSTATILPILVPISGGRVRFAITKSSCSILSRS
ncbi:Major Facilitator Superfamily protein [Burkholderia sp. GAS332]|nr:Major Facilitator Superfamily protein [Burkholderia sp. GAS332]